MKNFIITAVISLFVISTSQASTLEDLIVSGNTFWSQGKFAEAEGEFNKALKIDPDYSVAHARIANLYLTQNKTTEAVESFQNAINGDPENAQLFIGLAITYLHKQYYKMADAMVKQAIAVDPDLANAQKLQTYITAKRERISEEAKTTAVSSQASMHGQPSPHGKASTSTMPATIQKNIQNLH
ncbi:MAG: tetratricopeptide repeat protein [Gammaproteobacteria bacterium]|nr:tetratricopeptide repeat protein [Gammaproteobacteria bacterium]